MAEGTQKISNWGGLHLEKDNMEITEGQSPDCANTLVDVYGKLRSRPGYTKYNTTAYANPVTGLYDYAGLPTYTIQTALAYASLTVLKTSFCFPKRAPLTLCGTANAVFFIVAPLGNNC